MAKEPKAARSAGKPDDDQAGQGTDTLAGTDEAGRPEDDLAEVKDKLGEGAAGDGVKGEAEELDPADVECAEARNIEQAGEALRFDDPYFAVGDCRDAMLTMVRQNVDMTKMREGAQREIIAALSNVAVTIVQKIARALAAQGSENVSLTLEKLVVKDGLQLTLKGAYTHEALTMLGDAQGKMILVSLPDSERFDHQRAAPYVAPDRPELPLAGPEGDTDLATAGEPASNRVIYRDGDGNVKVRHRESGDDLGLPTDDEVKAFEERERADAAETKHLAEEGDGTRINLKTNMVERKVGEGPDGDRFEDVREATPDELAAERERQADFTE